jgi:hypothetical protein
MNEESKKIEKKVEKTEQEKAETANLSEQDLNKVSGGSYQPPKAGQIDKGGKDWGK